METFNMKSKALLVSFVALFAITIALSTVAAADIVDIVDIEVDGFDMSELTGSTLRVNPSETIPVVVKYTAKEDLTDLRITASLKGGYKTEIEDKSGRFSIDTDDSDSERFSLVMPSTEDFDDDSTLEEVTLVIEFDSDQGREEVEYVFNLRKEQDSLNLVSIDLSDVVVAGNQVAVDVVVENNGNNRLDNVYVKASIPGLGVSRKVYAGDLDSSQDKSDDDINDAVVKRIYLTIPNNAAPGNYEIEVEAYNYDASITAVGRVVIEDTNGGVLPSATSRTISPGQETTFDLVLVNPSNRLVVYNIMPVESNGVLVDISEPVVAVGADSSRTVKVTVRATENAKEGTYLATVNTSTDTGVSKQVNFSVNVEEPSKVSGVTGRAVDGTNTTVVLTVVLVIIFVVLLIILIVLLSKRPAENEEYGETNYY